ncbi:spore coat polysaccharide biosynthesis protein SpsC domain protein [Ostertagia ostertagi]
MEIRSVDHVTEGALVFSKADRELDSVACTVIGPLSMARDGLALIESDNPRLDFALALRLLQVKIGFCEHTEPPRIHPSVRVGRNTVIGNGVEIAMGIHQLRKINAFSARRQQLARRYFEGLADLPLLLPAEAADGGEHAWHLYVVRLTSAAPIGRNELIQKLSDHGIGTSVHYIPLHRHPYWRDTYHLAPEQFPEAEAAYHAMVSLPLYTAMTDEDQERVIRTLRELLC